MTRSASPAARKPLWIARLAGTQEEMGAQHGTLLAAAGGADAAFAHYPDMPERLLLGTAAPAARRVAGLIAGAALRRLDADRPAELRARSRAFVAALGRPPGDARYVAIMDVLQNAVGAASRLGIGPFASRRARALMTRAAQPACSTVMVWGEASRGGTLRHARNFDFPGGGVWDLAPALVLCAPAGGVRYGFVSTRGGDAPVVTVWNEAGLTFTTHTRFHRRVGWRGAAIVDLVHELAMKAETLADAARLAAARPSSSTWGIAVSSAREARAVVLEIHAGGVAVVEPAAGADLLTCANRYRDPGMRDGEATASHAWACHSDARERRLGDLARAACDAGGADAADLCRMLADREDPGAPGVVRRLGGVVAQPLNVHAAVVEPEARAVVLAVGPAPAVDGPHVRVAWDWDGPVGAWELDQVAAGAGIAVAPFDAGVARDPAAELVAEVARLEQQGHDDVAMAAVMERAVDEAPGDPSLRLGAVWTQLRCLDGARAAAHARAGLTIETIPYRRGQLLRWGARAAAMAGDGATAAGWRAELEGLRGAGVDELQAAARRDHARGARYGRRRPDASLFMMDAH
jgi:hypothetical protein